MGKLRVQFKVMVDNRPLTMDRTDDAQPYIVAG